MSEQSIEFKDFSGGMTDNWVNAPMNKFRQADNMFIRPDGKLQSRDGSGVIDDDYYQVPFTTTPKRVDSIYKFKGIRWYQTMGKLYRINSAWSELQGPGSTSLFSSSVSQGNQNSYAEWNNHLVVTNDYRVRPAFIYVNSGTPALRTLGLPKVTSAQVSSIGFSAGVGASRNYVFVRKHTYTIDGVEFTSRSAVSVSKNYTGAITNSITGLPVLTNATNEHYATSEIKLEIYRTVDAGDVYFYVGEVTNGTTTFSDSVSDVNLQLNDVLYLEQDDLDYDQPPECKFVVQAQGVMYFLNIKDSLGDVYPYRIVQANPDQIFAAPEANTVDVDGDITAAGVAGQNVIVFTADRTYRLQGFYDSTGGGGIQAIEISRTVGCLGHKSVVQTQQGCFFAAKDGFYFTDGYQVQRISEDLPATYASLTTTAAQGKRIYGTYDPYTKQAVWAATSSSTESENDVAFVAHLYFGIKPDVPFTRWSGGEWPTNFQPSAFFYDEDERYLIRGDSRGYVLVHSDDYTNDIKIDTATTPDLWTQYPVVYDYIGISTDAGSVSNRKWGTKLVVYATSINRTNIQPFSNNDNSANFVEMKEIRSPFPVFWGDDIRWGDSELKWNSTPITSGIRRFPKRGLRFSYKQIRLKTAYITIQDSTEYGTVTVDGSANTVTLDDNTLAWDQDAVDYYVSLSIDDYFQEYRVSARTSGTVLTLEDSANILPSGQYQFKLRGFRKRETIKLESYSVLYQTVTPSQSPYRGES